jgi:hypothetical protein
MVKERRSRPEWEQEYGVNESSKYQWLPAIYTVDENNKVKVTSYINNLEEEVT